MMHLTAIAPHLVDVLTMVFELLVSSFCPRLMKLKGVNVSCWGNSSGQRVSQRPTASPTFQHCQKSEATFTLCQGTKGC